MCKETKWEQWADESQSVLWKLLDERSQPVSEAEEIDRRIWDRYGDEGAIVFTDLCGFTHRSVEKGVIHFLQIIFESQRLLRPVIKQYKGSLIEAVGDSMLLWFTDVEEALNCSLEMQAACGDFNAGREPIDQMLLCVGISYGPVLRIGYSRLAGVEVNIASKLGEDIAEGYEILVSKAARQAATNMTGLEFTLTGIDLPGTDEVYRVSRRHSD